MLIQIAHLYALGCVAVMFFQIALIAGAPWGEITQGGQRVGALPVSGRVLAGLSIPVVLAQGVAILSVAEFPGLDWPRWTGWAALAVSVMTAILNTVTRSHKERAVWCAPTIVMAGLAGYVMIVTL